MASYPMTPLTRSVPTLGIALMLSAPAWAETLHSKTFDTRAVAAFKVKDAAAQAWLPRGYVAGGVPGGPFKSANLMLVFIDRLQTLSPDGKPVADGSYRMVAVVIPGKHADSGKPAMFIARIYAPQEGAGPYANSVKSAVERQTSRSGADVGSGSGADRWTVRHAGGSLSLSMDYQAGAPGVIEAEGHPTSATDPGIRRIYRYRQLVDVVRSVPAKIDRVSHLKFDVSIPELVDTFDGSEQLVGIGIIPWYSRDTFLP